MSFCFSVRQRQYLALPVLVFMGACASDPGASTGPTDDVRLAKAGGGLTATIVGAGDIALGPISSAVGSSPFKNLVLKGVVITLGQTLTGNESLCVQQPGRTYTNSWNEWTGSWTGEMSIWQGSRTTSSNFKFLGTRPSIRVGQLLDTLQFTSNDANAKQTVSGNVTTLAMADAPLSVGGASTYFDANDRDVNGLPILRCANVTFTSTQP